MNDNLADFCDTAYAMTILGGKWKIPIVWELREGPRRLSQLRRAMPGVAESVLIRQLRELERDHLVRREDHHELPLRVTYELAPLGAALHQSVKLLEAWGRKHRQYSASRARNSPESPS